MKLQAPKGTKDLLPQDSYKWQYVEDKMRKIAATFGCREIRTPMFESTELFIRGVGDTTDVVQKEMYTFNDKGNRSLTLKAEGTAPSVRAFIENSLFNEAQPTKLFYFTPVFRYENVQKGRLREHHQFGIEVFGAKEPSLDAEVISIAMNVFNQLGLENLQVAINSIGCPNCRKKYNEALKDYLKSNYDNLCNTCKTRFEKNPMRILDCKEDSCRKIVSEAPVILDYICDECREHFKNVKKFLEILNIKYIVDPHIVRGLDYYSKTVFEIINDGITVCGGGRYDYLIGEIGGPETPAMGFGMGIERLIMTLEQSGIEIPKPNYIDIFIGSMGEKGKLEALNLANKLRSYGIKCDIDHVGRSVKAQMKYSNKIDARFTAILGDEEIEKGIVKIKDMNKSENTEVELNNVEKLISIIKDN